MRSRSKEEAASASEKEAKLRERQEELEKEIGKLRAAERRTAKKAQTDVSNLTKKVRCWPVVVGCAGCFSDAFHFDFIPPPLPLQLESLEKTHALVEAELKETKAREEKLQTDVLALKKTGKGQSETALLKKQLAASKVAKDNAEKALEANSKTAEAEIKEKDALIAKCVCGCYAGVSTPHADSSFSYTGKPRKSRC